MFTPTDRARTYGALQQAQKNATEAEKLADGWFASSSLRTDAHSTRVLADTMAARWDTLDQRATYATAAEVAKFLEGCGATDITTARETADLLSPTTAVTEVVGGTINDAAAIVGNTLSAAGNVGSVLVTLLENAPYLIAAAAVAWVAMLAHRFYTRARRTMGDGK